ncbi:MAG: response regulator [Deltaproteobacteria bacterium]|jgi:signal transduction histidine kinase/CheY-like chemotaxis protein/HPt (histidine-containing phosphotransfer) domain-containing protein|nr:response regulator [Deltaproteobacteria bacterium]
MSQLTPGQNSSDVLTSPSLATGLTSTLKPDQKPRRRVLSLSRQFTLFFFFFILGLFAIIALTSIQQFNDATGATASRLGNPIVKRAAALIDGDAFEKLSQTLDPLDPFYDATRLKLLALKEEVQCLYLYTMIPYDDKQSRFVIDAGTPGEAGFSPLGAFEDITDYTSAYQKTYETQQPQAGQMDLQNSWGWVISTYAPIFNSSGKMVGLIGCDFEAETIFNSIFKRILQQFVYATLFMFIGLLIYRRLSRSITKQNQELIKITEKAERASRHKSDFLARASHEIRTPLNAIIGLSELARRERGSDKGLEYILGVKTAGASLLSIINDILDFSKIESGNLPIIEAPYDTASLLNDALTVIRVHLAEKPLELFLEISPDIPCTLIGDFGRVKQILLNLLNNAVKYTKDGFIKFSAQVEKIQPDQIQFIFTVADSGVGIKPEDMERLFKHFTRLEEKREGGVEGTGLGLAIAQSLAQAMGGDITVNSVYGQGSTFVAKIHQKVLDWRPMADISELTPRLTEIQRVTFRAPQASVLVVDDFHSNLLVAEGLLTPYQMTISTALNGHEAVEAATNFDFDLILMDHMMPGLDGLETTKLIRGLQAHHHEKTPIIALTANAIIGSKEMFLANGFNDFLAKPIEFSKLDEVLARWIPQEKQLPISVAEAEAQAAEVLQNRLTNLGAPKAFDQLASIEGLDLEVALNSAGGSVDRLFRLLSVFLDDVRSGERVLINTPPNLPSLATHTHALKSALSNLGHLSLASVAAKLEGFARVGDLTAIERVLPEFRDNLRSLTNRVANVILERRSQSDAQSSWEISPQTRDRVKDLAQALAEKDFDALEIAMEKLTALNKLTPNSFFSDWIDQVANQILNADYDQATQSVANFLDAAQSPAKPSDN